VDIIRTAYYIKGAELVELILLPL